MSEPTISKIPDDKTFWTTLRQAYFQAKGDEDEEYDEDLREVIEEDPQGGAVAKYEIRIHPERGRGVYAAEDIAEGIGPEEQRAVPLVAPDEERIRPEGQQTGPAIGRTGVRVGIGKGLCRQVRRWQEQ